MGAYSLRLCEARRTEAARLALTACPRVVYVLAGNIFVTTGGGRAHVTVDSTWHGVGGCSLVAGVHGATILRYELLRGASAVGDTAVAARVTSRLLLSPLLTLDETGDDLTRCDPADLAARRQAPARR